MARQFGIARATVAKFLRAAAFPELATPSRPHKIDPYTPTYASAGMLTVHTARTLWKKIRAQGYPSSDFAAAAWSPPGERQRG
jgi:hypothetical protein